jgi:putative membrane protein
MEYLVNKDEQEQIKKAIEKFEDKSSAEIVTVIAQQSDPYLYIPTLWAMLGAFVSAFMFSQTIQVIVFAILAVLFHTKKIKMLIVPSFVKRKRASNKAKEKFFELLNQDTQRDGLVMLYVSEAEKYVEILSDPVIAQKIDNSLWDDAIKNFIERVREGDIAKGYLDTIDTASELLIEKFPNTKDDKDTMPNHLILI